MLFSENLAVTATAASIAMDAFSVSICLGLCHEHLTKREALILGTAFGGFQFFMPLLGGQIAQHTSGVFGSWTPWMAAALIVWVAIGMIREAGKQDGCANSCMTVTVKNVILLAFATSLDALAVGFSIESTGGSAWRLSVIAGVITFALSVIGALVGKRLGERFGKNAEYFGGAVLLLIAAKIIFDVQAM
ncbi:MAG: manganese efflux pump MntP family protein [Cloacibacillus sp.]